MRELWHADGERVLVSRGITRRGTVDVSLIILIPDLIDGTGENIEMVAEAIATHVQLSPGGGG